MFIPIKNKTNYCQFERLIELIKINVTIARGVVEIYQEFDSLGPMRLRLKWQKESFNFLFEYYSFSDPNIDSPAQSMALWMTQNNRKSAELTKLIFLKF